MLQIRLTENAYLEGGEGVFYRYHTKDGKLSACGIYGNWYEAHAVDDDNNEYRVVWEISDREAFDNGDEDCCDWENPSEIVRLSDNIPMDAEIVLQFRNQELMNKHITFTSFEDMLEFINTDVESWESNFEGAPDLTIDEIAQEWEEWINDNPDRVITKEKSDELKSEIIAVSVKWLAEKVLERLENTSDSTMNIQESDWYSEGSDDGYEDCWNNGRYVDQYCPCCPYRHDCSGYDDED